MTLQEFSNEFDIYYNNIMSNQAPGLDEYEKSVFLTKAQDELVLAAYSGSSEAFESSEELRQYLAPLVCTKEVSPLEDSKAIGLSPNSKFFYIDENYLFITSEFVITTPSEEKCINKLRIPVIPVTQDEFFRIENNPFKGASKRRVLRLDISTSEMEEKEYQSRVIELVTPYNISQYIIRYVRAPKPIKLEADDLSINGVYTASPCELNPILHRKILERAVQLAKASFVGN